MSVKSKNYYELLEISPDSNQSAVTRGYIQAKNAYSQDSLALYSLMTDDECKEMLELIEEAYEILSDPEKRSAYDEARGLNKVAGHEAKHPDNATKDSEDYKYFNNSPAASFGKQTPRGNAKESLTKIIAKKRFSLKYEIDDKFEQKIEQTTEWTGAWLKEIREYKGVDIPRLSDMTKVSKTYLSAIEDEKFENLPPTAYVRGFVYQYAKCLKLNPDLVCSSYLGRIRNTKE